MAIRRIPAVLITAAVVSLGAFAAGATAAAPWIDPVVTSGAAPTPAPLLITKNGHALAFPATTLDPAFNPATSVVGLNPATGAATGAARGLALAGVFATAYARDSWVVTGQTLVNGRLGPNSRVQVAFGKGDGSFGALKGLSGSTGERLFGVAANDDGVVAILVGDTTRRLLIRRPDGRGFVQAFSVKVGAHARGATVAVGADGDVLAVWENEHHIYARHVGPSRSVGAVHHVGDGVQSHLQAAVEAGGRLMVAWASQRVDEGEAATPATVFYVTAGAGKTFGKIQRLEDVGPTGTGRYVSDPAVRLISGGASGIAWTGYDQASSHYVVRFAQISGGVVNDVENLSGTAANAVLGDLAQGDDGRLAVIWRTGVAGADPDGGPQAIVATTRPTTYAPFTAPESIASAPAAVPGASTNTSFPFPPRIALAPATGAALAELGTFAGTSSRFSVAARPAP